MNRTEGWLNKSKRVVERKDGNHIAPKLATLFLFKSAG
jgi:hypothetical protein